MDYVTISSASRYGIQEQIPCRRPVDPWTIRYGGDQMIDDFDDTVVALIIGLVAGLIVGWVRSVVAGVVAFAVAGGVSKLLLPALVGF